VYFRAKEWQAYKEVNALFADAIASIYKPGDLVFIHDYHLMLLPAMLRDRLGPAAGIGFFIHTPFPTSELFRCLPTREDLLKGMLGADLVGFQVRFTSNGALFVSSHCDPQTWDYSRHFMSSCRRSLPPQEVETCHNGVVVLHGDTRRQVELIVCPTGIDPQVYEESVRDPETTTKLEELQQRYGQYKVIVGRYVTEK
jgi:trehalose-6-phosphate synthase